MMINYNSWFYDQHKYLKNSTGYVDTKWVDINKRYERLRSTSSDLLSEQPYAVVANDVGVRNLIELLNRSSYTFEDLDQSLIDTYKVSLKNAMSRMLVNTHAVMFSCDLTDDEHVSSDPKTGNAFIVDIPFDQLHFGDRDEFIRNKLSMMHNVASDNYIRFDRFIQDDVTKILGFTLICSVNGYVSNDWEVALSERGFKFKIRWKLSNNAKFIIYKLDESIVKQFKVSKKDITVNGIRNNDIASFINKNHLNGCKCLIDIYSDDYVGSMKTVIDFGVFNSDGSIRINQLQNKTVMNLNAIKNDTINVVVYVIKYLKEVKHVYPSINFYDVVDSRAVYDDKNEVITDVNGNTIVSSSIDVDENVELCTPPIVIDRENGLDFTVINACISLKNDMLVYESLFKAAGKAIEIMMPDNEYRRTIRDAFVGIVNTFNDFKRAYYSGTILTSLVDQQHIHDFDALCKIVTDISNTNSYHDIESDTRYDILFGDNYRKYVEELCKPFSGEKFKIFDVLNNVNTDFYPSDYHDICRPVSEQCFISFKYDIDSSSWLFDLPDIKRFKGIQNAFYIDTGLHENDLYKFFVLYTDTESHGDDSVYDIDDRTVIDFDMFCKEMDKHQGFIRYWNVESRLMKLCSSVYGEYSSDKCVAVLSKILKNKLDDVGFLNNELSDFNYEDSNVTSDCFESYTSISERAPFAVNFMFYTLSCMSLNADGLEYEFYRYLTNKVYDNRYSDINIASAFIRQPKLFVNYSQYQECPNTFDTTHVTDTDVKLFSGIPHSIDASVENGYKYTFNVYKDDQHFPLIKNGTIDESQYVTINGTVTKHSFENDMRLIKLLMEYIRIVYDAFNDLQTNYKKSLNVTYELNAATESLNKVINDIRVFTTDREFVSDVSAIVDSIVTDNIVVATLNDLRNDMKACMSFSYGNKTYSPFKFFDDYLKTIRNINKYPGYDKFALKRLDTVYEHMCKSNKRMNPYQYQEWLLGIDTTFLQKLGSMVTYNGNPTDEFKNTLDEYANKCLSCISSISNNIPSYIAAVENLYTDTDTHISAINTFLSDTLTSSDFNLYTVEDLIMDLSKEYDTEPYYIAITLTSDSHFYPPGGSYSERYLYLGVHSDKSDDKYVITEAFKLDEYAFFNGTDYTGTLTVYDKSGNSLDTQSCVMKFRKTSSIMKITDEFEQLPYAINTRLDFQNPHEDFEVETTDDTIITSKFSPVDYELLMGNHFEILDHTSQMVRQKENKVNGSIDRIYLDNGIINDYMRDDVSNAEGCKIYFKPCQIHHETKDSDGVISSVGGRFFEGERVYLKTQDDEFVFPVIITAIDHSINKGFVEAKVDSYNAKWKQLEDVSLLSDYLNGDIECEILEDNMRNFLDEFSNGDYESYIITNPPYNENVTDLRGDPLYVETNASYVYTRINWMFNKDVDNRFIDDDHKMYHFIYMGHASLNDDSITVNLINHNMNTLTNPQMYPTMIEDLSDQVIKHEEREKINELVIEYSDKYDKALKDFMDLEIELATTDPTPYRLQEIQIMLEALQIRITDYGEKVNRYKEYLTHMDYKSMWYNIPTYESSLVYINSGRAKIQSSFITSIKDIPYTDDLEVFLYDWEHKEWIDPDDYTVTANVLDEAKVEPYADYKTSNVYHSITITPTSDISSRKILVYFGYGKSDVFDDIDETVDTCSVRFKPMIDLNECRHENQLQNINIRKQFSGTEKYLFKADEPLVINRINRNGKYKYNPHIRFCDVTVLNANIEYNYTYFDFYVPNPFANNLSSDVGYMRRSYAPTIDVPINNFENDKPVTLICLENTDKSIYDGHLSTLVFRGRTYSDAIVIESSSLPTGLTGTFKCTVIPTNDSDMSGGIVTITVINTRYEVFDDSNNWIKIVDDNVMHHNAPDKFMIVPKSSVVLTNETTVILSNGYDKDYDDTIAIHNDYSYRNPYEYYYDEINHCRYPISNTKQSNPNERLVIDTTENTNVKIAKAQYIGICRYSLSDIPVDGIIDMTGYLPTPITRDRYEFWVNGRCIKNNNDLIILSPTSIQLCNMTSLKNFEAIELVDDINDNVINRVGVMYYDPYTNSSSSSAYKIAVNKGHNHQSLKYTFNTSQHIQLDNYSRCIIGNPNNRNIEKDILDNIDIDVDPTSYDELYNIPTINGVQIKHTNLIELGLSDIPFNDILNMYDKTWKLEETTNRLFPMTHKTEKEIIGYVELRCEHVDDELKLYTIGSSDKFYTMYITNTPDASIDDTTNTVMIIPYMKNGVIVTIPDDYIGKWLCCTHEGTTPILLE